MINNILKKLGYIHKSELTESYIFYEAAKIVGDPKEYEISDKEEDIIFGDLSKIDGFSKYLDATMARDMQRYFSSPKDQLDIVRGAFARTSYIKSRITGTNTKKIEAKTKLENLRYG